MKPYSIFAYSYDEIMPESWYEDSFQLVTNIINKYDFIPKSILEFACGTGRLTRYLERIAPTVGMDISQTMLDVAIEQNSNSTFIVADMFSRNLKIDKEYDLIVCTYDALNYAKTEVYLRDAFKNFNKLIKPGGLIIFDLNGKGNFAKKGTTISNEREIPVSNGKLIWKNRFTHNKWIANLVCLNSSGKIIGEEVHKEYFYSIDTVKNLVIESGLTTLDVFSNSKLIRANDDGSRYYFVATKTKLDS